MGTGSDVAERLLDSDGHFQEPLDWLQRIDPTLAVRVPGLSNQRDFAEAGLNEILEVIPEPQRPVASDLISSKLATALDEVFGENADRDPSEIQKRIEDHPVVRGFFAPKGAYDADERLDVLEEHGIELQFMNPTLARFLVARGRAAGGPDLAHAVTHAYNRWATEQLDGHTDRLVPVALVELDDVDWAVRELGLARERGCRGFQPPLDPVGGRTLGDPANDPVWAAALDLGILPILHVGRGTARLDPAWAMVGGEVDGRIFARMTVAERALVARLAMSAMVYGGVFDRFPDLVVLCEEWGVAWVRNWLDNLGPGTAAISRIQTMFGWPYAKTPEQYVLENFRFSVPPGQRADEVIAQIAPEVALFSTDYPHPEGAADAAVEFDRRLATTDPDARDRYFFANLAELLARGN